ncbi:hypothetical protein [Streptomyces sp. Isolate_45]|uniref:hypothetical protein n=1 Tax=Streptomyces sp. Isolate_45 TaxID=2950111 RepID=UPI002481BE99|nr:hypothetical protein [Streptomyces sp. Isolate_45]MDA5279913.1 hypothetical protein [Streptomyces sp. Isolate_45]
MTDDRHQHFMDSNVRRPDDIPPIVPLTWLADKHAHHGDRLLNNLLPDDFPHDVDRGTAGDALTLLALGTALRRSVEQHRGVDIHQALTLGATWAEVALALDVDTERARTWLQAWADGQRSLYLLAESEGHQPMGLSASQHAAVVALTERGDGEALPPNASDPGEASA